MVVGVPLHGCSDNLAGALHPAWRVCGFVCVHVYCGVCVRCVGLWSLDYTLYSFNYKATAAHIIIIIYCA